MDDSVVNPVPVVSKELVKRPLITFSLDIGPLRRGSSQSALAALQEDTQSQRIPLGAAVWISMLELVTPNRCVHLQWVPSQCGIGGNERSDTIAKEAAVLTQRAPR